MIQKLIAKERKAEKVVSIFSFAMMTILVSINVALRYAFGKSLVFTEELSYVFFNWFVLIGVCNIFRNRGLVAVDAIVGMMPKVVAWADGILVDVVVLGTNIVLTYLSVKLSITGFSRKTPALMLPYTIMYIPAVISFFTMSISSVSLLIEDLKSEKGEPQHD